MSVAVCTSQKEIAFVPNLNALPQAVPETKPSQEWDECEVTVNFNNQILIHCRVDIYDKSEEKCPQGALKWD